VTRGRTRQCKPATGGAGRTVLEEKREPISKQSQEKDQMGGVRDPAALKNDRDKKTCRDRTCLGTRWFLIGEASASREQLVRESRVPAEPANEGNYVRGVEVEQKKEVGETRKRLLSSNPRKVKEGTMVKRIR